MGEMTDDVLAMDARVEASYLTFDLRCWSCHRLLDDDWRWVGGERVCGRCWDKADVGPDVDLDMTEDEDAGRQ